MDEWGGGEGRASSARMIIFLYHCKEGSTARRRISYVVVGSEADDRFPLFPSATYPLGIAGKW
jgi:hypothetical protein